MSIATVPAFNSLGERQTQVQLFQPQEKPGVHRIYWNYQVAFSAICSAPFCTGAVRAANSSTASFAFWNTPLCKQFQDVPSLPWLCLCLTTPFLPSTSCNFGPFLSFASNRHHNTVLVTFILNSAILLSSDANSHVHKLPVCVPFSMNCGISRTNAVWFKKNPNNIKMKKNLRTEVTIIPFAHYQL